MKAFIASLAIGLMLTAASAEKQPTVDQNNDFVWDGPGYYAEEAGDWGHGQEVMKVGGPFESFAACQKYVDHFSDHASNTNRMCAYRGLFFRYHQP